MSEPTIQESLQALATAVTALVTAAELSNEDKDALVAFANAFKTAPVLGGNLNVNDKEIVSAEGGNVVVRPDNEFLAFGLRAPGVAPRILGAVNTVVGGDNGRVLYSDSASAYAITVVDECADWFAFALWSSGEGLPTMTMSGTDTVDGATTWTPESGDTFTLFVHTGGGIWKTL